MTHIVHVLTHSLPGELYHAVYSLSGALELLDLLVLFLLLVQGVLLSTDYLVRLHMGGTLCSERSR
jgi:hypothetical protein